MAATLKDVAGRTGLSISTVSRVLNRKGGASRISKATVELVLRTAEELNYQPDVLARGLRLKRTQTLGLVVPDIANPFFSHLTRSIQKAAHRYGCALMVCNSEENVALERTHTELLVGKRVDGLILAPTGEPGAHFALLGARKAPFVFLDRNVEGVPAPAVLLDNRRGGYVAARALLEAGHRRIGLIQGSAASTTTIQRREGYLEALGEAGIAPAPELMVGRYYSRESGYAGVRQLLALAEPPTALFATSDVHALGALEAVLEAGLRIPDDLSMVSFDDVAFAPFLFCPLTTVAQPWEAMGEAAVDALMRRIDAETQEYEKQVFAPTLITRASIGRI